LSSFELEKAKEVLLANTIVPYGVFGVIEGSGYFPPRFFLNEFFMSEYDPCDQDGRMGRWEAFSLSNEDYLILKQWWICRNPDTVEDSLSTNCWLEWVEKVFEIVFEI
jgi:hypothetical protein